MRFFTRLLRVGLVVAASLLLVVVVLLAVLHTPPVRARVAAWAAAMLQRDYGIDARIGRLDYNLLTLNIEIENVRLAAADRQATPLVTARRVRVDLPWTAILGTTRLESLSIEQATIAIEHGKDGRWNLPEVPTREPAGAASAIDLGRLDLRDILFRFTDPALNADVELSSLSLTSRTTSPTRPWLPADLAGTLRVRTGSGPLEADMKGTLRLTGEGLSLEPLALTTTQSHIESTGLVRLFASEPTYDLRYRMDIDLSELASLIPRQEGEGSKDPSLRTSNVETSNVETSPRTSSVGTLPIRGALRASGTVAGALAAPRIEVDLSSDSLAYDGLEDIRLQSRASIEPARVTIKHLQAAVGNGRLDARGTVGLDRNVRSQLDSTWRGLDVGALVSSFAGRLPVQLVTEARGTARIDGPALDWTDWRVSVHATLTPTTSAQPGQSRPQATAARLPLGGTLAVDIAKRRWSVVPDLSAEGLSVRGQAGGELWSARSEDDARSTAASADGSLSGRLTLHAVDIARLLDETNVVLPGEERIDGSLDARVDLGGSLQKPRVGWTFTSRDLVSSSLGAAQLDARGTAATRGATVDDIRLAVAENTLVGRAAVSFATRRVDGSFRADVPEIATLARAMPARWRPTGTLKMTGRLAGTTTRPALDVAIASSNLQANGQRLDSLNAQLHLTPSAVRIERLTAAQGTSGLLEASGRYGLSSNRYELDARGRNLHFDPPPDASHVDGLLPVAGRVSFEARGQGTVARPSGTARLTLSELAWRGTALGPIDATVTADGRRAVIDARASSLATELRATQDFGGARPFEMTARVTDLDVARLSPFLPGAKLPVTGRVSLDGRANGYLDRLADTEGTVTLTNTSVTVGDQQIALARPATVRYSPRGVAIEGLELVSGSSRLTGRGAFGLSDAKEPDASVPGEGLHVEVDARAADLMPIVEAFSPVPLTLDGSLRLDATAAGTPRAPRLTATVSLGGLSVGYQDLPAVTGLDLDARLAAGVLTIDRLTGTWQTATIAGTASAPMRLFARWLPESLLAALPATDAEARVQLTAAPLTAAALEPFVDDLTSERVDGELAVSLDARAASLDLAAVTATLTLDRGTLALAGVRVEQVEPTRVSLASGRARVDTFAWRGPGTNLRMTGGVSLRDEPRVIDLDAFGNVDLRLLGAFARDVGTAGSATFSVRARGAATSPQLDGRIEVVDGELVLRDPRVFVSDVEGAIVLDEQRISATDITGTANGGPIRLDATVDVSELPNVTGIATVTGRNVAFEYPDGLRAELDADLRVDLAPRETLIAGDVTLLRGAYREPIILTGTLGHELFGGGGLPGTTAPAGAPSTTATSSIRLDIALVSQEDLLVDNNYGRFGVGLDVTLLGTLDQPGIAGRVELREGGELYLGGLVYRIDRGSADFTDPARLDPMLDLVAETHVGATGVTLQASGTPDTLDVTVESPDQPQMSEADLYALVAGGGGGASSSEMVRTQLLSAISGDLFALAGRTIGVDALRLERGVAVEDIGSEQVQLATEENPAARLTVTKRFPRDVEIILSQSLRETGALTWIASYRPLRDVELRGVSRDDESRSYEFRHSVAFGGERTPATPSPRRATAERVAAVVIRGVSDAEERALARRLRLGAGDRFDFYRWQEDRDRVAAYLTEQGYFEHRIRASRRAAGAARGEAAPEASGAAKGRAEAVGLRLDYTIDTGPRCELIVRGVDLPAGTRRRMRDAWSAAVFDAFLSDDLTTIARRHLIETGHPRVRVQVKVATEANIKRAVVAIEPGSASPWRIEYTGNTQVSAAELEAFVSAEDLAVTAWLDPQTFERRLGDWYRARGFLAAFARVGAATESNGPPSLRFGEARRSATRGGGASRGEVSLPVEIREGPLYTVTAVHVTGAHAELASGVREWFRVADSSVYLPLDAEIGRRNVEAAYRNAGFAEARVSLDVGLEPRRSEAKAGRVLLTLAVTEGPRQVLEDVVIRGAPDVDEPVITRTLGLQRGAPIDLRTLFEARRRLYETGVFQRVDIRLEPLDAAAQPAPEPLVSPKPGEGGAVITDQAVRAVVELQERPRYHLRYGVGVNDEPSSTGSGRTVTPGLAADLENRNLFGTTATGGIAGRYQRRRQAGRVFLTLPNLLGAPLATTLFVERSHQLFDVETEGEDRTSVALFQRLRLRRTEGLSVEYGYTYAWSRTFSDDPIFPEIVVTVPRLTASAVLDRRDDASDTTHGWLHSSTFEYSDTWLASDLRFVRYLAQQYYFRPLGDAIVSASALRLGAARAIGDEVLIPSEMFRMGGSQTLRGYAQDSIVGEDFLPENALLLLNQEVRFPIYRWVRGVGFVDAGNVFDTLSDVSFDLEVGVGGGLRIDTPFALLRVDMGVPLSRDEDGRRRPRFYFSLGQAF
ncbi:MAG: BamA/TamA family outer membrane protein [Luteitalea sp.]|nr:BamA/TamA family outer membrane protein [Luteitalea sp.]